MKKIAGITSSIAVYLSSATGAFALDLCPDEGIAKDLCNSTSNPTTGFSNLMQVIINGAFLLAIVAALGYLIYGGIRWILSQGDKTKVEAARNHVMAAIIGMVIVFLSYLIINIVVQIFTGHGLSSIEIPSIVK